MTVLPGGWASGPLSEFVRPKGEKVSPADFPDLPFVGMDHVEAHSTRIVGSVPSREMKSNASRFRRNDVLYGRLRPYLNKVAQPGFDGLASAEFIVFKGNALMDPGFLRYRLHTQDFVSFASHLNEGDRPRVSFEQIGNFEILLPPPNEQRRIVERVEALFDEIDRGVESLRAAKRAVGLYRQSLLKAAFEGRLTADWRGKNPDKLESPAALAARIANERQECYRAALDDWELALRRWHAKGETGIKPAKPRKPSNVLALEDHERTRLPPVPDSWGFNRLGLYIGWIQAGKSFKCVESEPAMDQVGVAKVSAVTWGEYDEAESKTCLNERNVNEKLFIREGDFLLSRANTIELVGASVIAKRVTKKIMLSDKTLRIHFAVKDRRFFLHYLRSPYGRAEIQARSTGNQTSMRNIGQDRINSIVLPICSPAEQAEIVRILDARLGAAEALDTEIEANLTRADALRQSILKQAFSGRLVPQDPTDEPADILLQRINAARASQMPRGTNRKSKVPIS